MLAMALAEQVHVLVLVTSGNEFLQTEKLKVVSEVSEEIAHTRIITIAQHNLSTEMVTIMLELFVDVFQLRVKLVFLGSLGLVNSSSWHNKLIDS